MVTKRNIPDPVKRLLRQEAGFGCCACGHPFVEYHHILQFADQPHHRPADMMVVCPVHHHQATVNAIDEAAQREMKARPYNITRGYVDGQLLIPDAALGVQIGTVQFVGQGFKILVDDRPLFGLFRSDGGRLALTADIFDEGDRLLISLNKNEWVTGSALPWDFEFGYNWLLLRKKRGDIGLEINAKKRPVEISFNLWFNKQRFSLRHGALIFNGVVSEISYRDIALIGMRLHVKTDKMAMAIESDMSAGEAMFVSESDPLKRFEKALEAYKKLVSRSLGFA